MVDVEEITRSTHMFGERELGRKSEFVNLEPGITYTLEQLSRLPEIRADAEIEVFDRYDI